MRKPIFSLIFGIASLLIPITASATVLGVQQGGTASSTLTGLLKGNGIGSVLTAAGDIDFQNPITLTTSGSSGAASFIGDVLNIPQYTSSGGAGIGTVATSGLETAGQVAIFGTSSGYPAKVYSVATSTPTLGSEFTYSGTVGSWIGGANGTLHIASAGVTNAMLANSSIVVNGTTFNLGDTHTITAASSTLLANNNTFSGNNVFSASTTVNAHLNLQDATSTTFGTGVFYNTGITSALGLFDANHKETAYGGSAPCTNQVALSISATGVITCTSVANAMLSNSTISGTVLGGTLPSHSVNANATLTGTAYNGTAAVSDWSINLNNKNWWTALQQFTNASSTQFEATSTVWLDNTKSALLVTDSNGKVATYGGSSCTNQVPTSQSALGAWTCSSVTDSFFSGQLSLAHGGTNASLSGAFEIPYINSGNTALVVTSLYQYQSTTGRQLTGTSTAQYGLTTLGTSTVPQLLLSDNAAGDNMWTLRSVGNILYIATSTATATSSVTALTLDANGFVTVPAVKSAIELADSNGKLTAYGGASACSANNFVTTLSAVGGTTCGTAAISGVNLGSNLNSLSKSGSTLNGTSYNGSAAVSDWAINLTNPNTWTGLQQFSNASSSQFSAYTAYFGGTATDTVLTNGNFGISSSTPWAAFSLGANAAIVTTEASSTGSGYNTINFQLQNNAKVEMNANTTINLALDAIPGEQQKVTLCQDTTGSRTVTWLSSSTLVWAGGTTPTQTATAGACDIYSFYVTGATGTVRTFGAATQNFP